MDMLAVRDKAYNSVSPDVCYQVGQAGIQQGFTLSTTANETSIKCWILEEYF